MTDQQNPAPQKASDRNLIEEYNAFLDEIPWDSLKKLPEKLGKYAGFLGIKDPKDLDITDPLKRIIEFIGVLVSRLRSTEKKAVALTKRVEELEKKLAEQNS